MRDMVVAHLPFLLNVTIEFISTPIEAYLAIALKPQLMAVEASG